MFTELNINPVKRPCIDWSGTFRVVGKPEVISGGPLYQSQIGLDSRVSSA
jgi:hypothetical protein